MRKNIQINYHRLIIFLLFLLQIGFVNCYLPFSEWVNENPIYTDDYTFHYTDALYKKMYLSKSMMACGYNPYIRAGSANNAILTVDNNGWGLFVFLTIGNSVIVVVLRFLRPRYALPGPYVFSGTDRDQASALSVNQARVFVQVSLKKSEFR